MHSVLAGVLVGGASSRMGGKPKGLLKSPSGTAVVVRAYEALRAAGVSRVVLVGPGPAYRALGLPVLDDAPLGRGPLAGLLALLERASAPGDPGCARFVLALACDMPFVSEPLLRQLAEAPPSAILAPRRGERWEPLCARYEAARVLPVARRRAESGEHSLKGLLAEVGATALPLTPDEARSLDDWDSPDDVIRAR